MPLHSAYPTLNFVFNLVHLCHVSQEWVKNQSAGLLAFDAASTAGASMAFHVSLLILFRQIRESNLKSGGNGESMIMDLLQHVFMGYTLIYIHWFHRDMIIDEGGGVNTWIFFGFSGLVIIHVLMDKFSGDGLLPNWLSERLLPYWRRFMFMMPSNPRTLFYYFFGYAFTRIIFPWSQGHACALWSPADSATSFERPGGEICPYTWPSTSSSSSKASWVSATGVRGCFDLSLLCLIYGGVIWPLIEFGRVFIIRCSALHAPYTPPKDHKSKSSAVSKQTNTEDEDDDEKHGHGSGIDPSSASLFARVFAFTNMAALCMFVTWVYCTVLMAYTNEFSIVLPASSSSCLTPSQPSSYDREISLLRNSPCTFQFSYLQNVQMGWYISCGTLAALFGMVPNTLPVMIRIQVLVVMSMSLWKGSVLPSCLNLAAECIK